MLNTTGIPARDWYRGWATQMQAFGCVEPSTRVCVEMCKGMRKEDRCGVNPKDLEDFQQVFDFAPSSCPPCSGGGNSTISAGGNSTLTGADNSTLTGADNSTMTGAERLLAISVTIAITNFEGNKAAVDDCSTPLSTPCQLAEAEMAFFAACGSPHEAVTEE